MGEREMKPASEVTALVADNGLFCELASKLAQTYKRVLYAPSWQEAFPKMTRGMIGYGLEGLEIVDSVFGPHFDDVDLFIFPDLNYGPLQTYLRSIGKAVWGYGMGEELEQDREFMKKLQKKIGLPVGPYEVITGTVALREYLKANDDQYVKMSKWRGTFESFHSINYDNIEPRLDEIDRDMGAFKTIAQFVVEAALPDCVELGIDGYTVDGQYPTALMAGIEMKNCGYVGAFKQFSQFPKPLTDVDRALSPIFKTYGYRGYYSTEVRIGEDRRPYLIDMTCRAPSPPNELYQEFYTNLADIQWQGANGVMVDPKPIAKFGAQIRLMSQWANEHWQPVRFPAELRQQVKLTYACRVDGGYSVIPQGVGMVEIGSVIGWGDTLKAAIESAKKVAEKVEGYEISASVESMDEAETQAAKATAFGLRMF